MPVLKNDSFLSHLPSLRTITNCDTFIHTSSIQAREDQKSLVTKISFTKTSTKIPLVQKCHRLILASAGSSFLNMILNLHHEFDDDIHISMPDFDKKEIEIFLKFVYGEIKEIDQNLSICQLFLKRLESKIYPTPSFELKKEKDEYIKLNPPDDYNDFYESPQDIGETGSDQGNIDYILLLK